MQTGVTHVALCIQVVLIDILIVLLLIAFPGKNMIILSGQIEA